MENAKNKNRKKQESSSLLKDDRFKSLFSNPDFQIDKNTEEYILLNPVISQLDKSKAKELKRRLAQQEEETRAKPDEDEARGNEHFWRSSFVLEKSIRL